MISFKNDYSEGAHLNILKALISTNEVQQIGYGDDDYCNNAKKLIKSYLKNDSDIHFVSGGTQANLTIISSILRPHESVIAVSTGHIAVHETGAIEATGHKINTVETIDGKLRVNDIKNVLEYHEDEHMVKPKLVYISNTTEIGGVYTKKEITDIYNFCQQNNLYLHIDGARLGSALTSKNNDVTLSDLAKLCDVFYIGGTKNGALLGEAIVINNENLKNDFRFFIKQKGALLAKGRILGLQFQELFSNNLFFDLANHANKMAEKIANAIIKKGYDFVNPPESNQLFPILPNELLKILEKKYSFYVWKEYNNNYSAIRLVTSWATTEEYVNKFITDINKY